MGRLRRGHFRPASSQLVYCRSGFLPSVTIPSNYRVSRVSFRSQITYTQAVTESSEMTLSLIVWMMIGVSAGFTASRLSNERADRFIPEVLLGVAGAITGGWVCYRFGPAAVNGLHMLSLLSAVFGSLLLLLTYHAIRRF